MVISPNSIFNHVCPLMTWAARICLAFFLLTVGLMEAGAAGAGKLDAGQWKHSVPLVVRNPKDRPVSNAVMRVEIEIRDGMKPDLGDIRLADAAGYEIPAMVADVRECFGFNLIFAVDLPAGGKKQYLLLYGNSNAERRDRLSLADTPLNCVPNPGFEEGVRDDPRMPTGWNCQWLPPGAGTGRTAENVCSGSWSMRIYAATATTAPKYPWMQIGFPLAAPLRTGEQIIFAVSSKSKNMPPIYRNGAHARIQYEQIQNLVSVTFPSFDYDWMTLSVVYTAATPKRVTAPAPVPLEDPDAVPVKPVTPEDDVVLSKNIRLLVGAQSMPADCTLWFDDVFIARYVDVEADIGQ